MKREVAANWRATVLVCRKCQKKVGKRYGTGRDLSLAKALRQAVNGGKGRKASVGVVETGCLGVCPKGAVTVVNAGDPGRWHLVPSGASGAEVAALLGVAEVGGKAPSA